ncbi:MAG: UDP-N-acetylmuramoyl-tripeptide--D-alanyl-D-alanine ligase [Prevotellaceae bacterium]|jgi:UDP-N-acetylmuramoyl-tripeptide--D-alanyl-D-alanine ligase|nr:UDP-N-acetylmuramoyl-tripeptide--D-alanyl-D-alanine ligase [Prevotellaceae bacterium]
MELYSVFLKHPVVCTDSRNCPPASLFFALKGANFNGNAYACQALEKGCACAVVDEAEYARDERYILVDDALKALQDLASRHRKQLGTTLIGITGTNGKTTTKELIATVLSRKYRTLYTGGNLNNHIGVPLTLLKLTAEHEIGVIEMGASHAGEIRELANIVSPDYGIITNVGKAHLEGFGSFEGVMQAKSELYDFIAQNGGKIFINAGNDYLAAMARKSGIVPDKWIKYGKSSGNDLFVQGDTLNNLPVLEMKCRTKGESFEIKTNLTGVYNAENVLATVATGHFFGVSDREIAAGIEHYEPKNNRSQLLKTKRNTLIVDAYNANPNSMSEAIRNFAQLKSDNKVLILGDMLELGAESQKEHQNIVGLLQSTGFTNVLLVGRQFKSAEHNFYAFDDVASLNEYLQRNPVCDAWALIKGSRGIMLEKTIEFL